jgi:hypothetical protein
MSNDGKKEEKQSTLELLVIDNGPGMVDVGKMMKDGVSTSNTLGHGLGAIQRLSTVFQVFSIPKWGTVSYTTLSNETVTRKKALSDFEYKALLVPKPKETFCGDGFAVTRKGDSVAVFFGDGLGHGEHAYEAVQKAKEFFYACAEEEPVEIIRAMHTEVRRTRGLVGCVAALDTKAKRWKICGVGNIITRLYGGMMFKHYMSYNGIIGLNIPNSMKETVIEAEKNQQLIMCSDGIRTRWDLTRYPSILKFDNMILAGALYKDFCRGTDDASILIGKVLI